MSDAHPLAPPARDRRRHGWRGAAIAGVLLLAAVGWLGGSEGGGRALWAGVEVLSGGRLRGEEFVGRLFSTWQLGRLRWQQAGGDVVAESLQVRWSPAALWRGRLDIEHLAVGSLRIELTSDRAAGGPPTQLRLPLAVRVERLELGPVRLGPSAAPTTLADGVAATLYSDDVQHRLQGLHVRRGELTLDGEATLATQAPFRLRVEASVRGRLSDQPLALHVQGEGPLERWPLDGRIERVVAEPEGAIESIGTLRATLTPFAACPLAALRVQATGFDPSRVFAGAPMALLDVDARLEEEDVQAQEPVLGGHLQLTNRLSGRLEQARLPLRELHSRIVWRPAGLSLDALRLKLAGAGQISGQGRWAAGQLTLALEGKSVDLRSLHARLPSTRLAGPVRARLGGDDQALELAWRDRQYTVDASLTGTAQRIELKHLDLSDGTARVSAQGTFDAGGAQTFSAQGRLRELAPERLFRQLQGAGSRISADFDVRGQLGETPALDAVFSLRDSRLGPSSLSGRGAIALAGREWRNLSLNLDLDLSAAGNQLSAHGALGRNGDPLRLKIRAPRLAALGWSGLSGDLRADAQLGGGGDQRESTRLSAELHSTRLRVPGLIDFKNLQLTARVDPGAQGILTARIDCASCILVPADLALSDLAFRAAGQRDRHRLEARAVLPDRRSLHLAFDGGLSAASAWTWNGRLSEAQLTGYSRAQPVLGLSAPAPLRVTASAFSFGPAAFAGPLGGVRLERLALQQGGWQSQGTVQGFSPQKFFSEFPALVPARMVAMFNAPQPLSLAGEWMVAPDPAGRLAGQLVVWREGGDLNAAAQPLGLSELRLEASRKAGRLALNAVLRGSRLGELRADLDAPIARTGGSGLAALLDVQAPWQGGLQAQLPDLLWLSPLLGDGWQLGGRVEGSMRLSGSPARPVLNGAWQGSRLAVRSLDLGLRLERGEARLEVTPERLLLHDLSFASDFQPLPRVLAAVRGSEGADASLTATPGQLTARGELALGRATPAARLAVSLDRVGVVQRRDQWIAVSGDAELRAAERGLEASGRLRADAGFWSLADFGRPALSDDVVVRRATDAKEKPPPPARSLLKLDLSADLGERFHFEGAGVESRLAGQIHLRTDEAGLPRATGSIRTVEGRFDAYGQKLGIERGIVNFQGAIDNPGLNILAVRKNLPVEAGVELSGSAKRPVVRLVSTPEVPDTEKLSWLVLGRPPEQQGGGDGALLLAAAQSLVGSQDGGLLRQLQRGLGIDEFGISSGQVGGSANHPTSRVASSGGFGGTQTVNGQIMSVGKRLSSNALLSYEQSLNTTESIVKLTVSLNRQFSVVGTAGTESALDVFWNRSFGQ